MSKVKIKDKIFFIIQALLKYNSFDWGIKARSFFYRFFFKSFGKNIQIKDGVTFKYPSEICLGNNIKIGELTYFVGLGGLYIGDNVLIGAGTKIITTSHNFENSEIDIFDQGLCSDPIVIKNNIWFGFDCKIFGGAIIENGVIVGAGSLVKKCTLHSYTIVAGMPAKVIKKRRDERTVSSK